MREPLSKTGKEIVRYYLLHPETADTCEGLVRWRLQEEQIDRTVEEVCEALDWLTDRGLLLERTQGSQTLFQLNLEEIAEARKVLEELEASSADPVEPDPETR